MLRRLTRQTLARAWRRLAQWQQRRAPVAPEPNLDAVRERVHARVAALKAQRERQQGAALRNNLTKGTR